MLSWIIPHPHPTPTLTLQLTRECLLLFFFFFYSSCSYLTKVPLQRLPYYDLRPTEEQVDTLEEGLTGMSKLLKNGGHSVKPGPGCQWKASKRAVQSLHRAFLKAVKSERLLTE